ncbi:tRNA-binding protein [Pedobacter arcticus]|uniref:tRNA-binding protein n=1 Tax=Pedobacter arcticus TaxID=752140 RepID=UPI00037DB04B|nr:tRNA-binding protein [Pedobacter arcticus]
MNIFSAFESLDIRVGTIIKAVVFKEVKKPAYKIWIDFGELGIKKTSAQITVLYLPEQLVGKQVTAIVNFEPKQIANFMSECLILGAVGEGNSVTLLTTDKVVENGVRVG